MQVRDGVFDVIDPLGIVADLRLRTRFYNHDLLKLSLDLLP
jgi:hypothetical protein